LECTGSWLCAHRSQVESGSVLVGRRREAGEGEWW
jgi:hypothetical protein